MKKLKSIVTNLHTTMIKEDYIYKQKCIQIRKVPEMEKIIIHSSSNKMTFDKKFLSSSAFAAELIALQKAVSIVAKKAVAAFHLRKNQIIALRITLTKRDNFFNFFEKLIYLVYPTYREFNGLARVDSFGTCNNSFTNFSLFPETKLAYQYFDFLSGFDLSIKLKNKGHFGQVISNKKTIKKIDNSNAVFFSFFPLPTIPITK